MRFLVDLYRYIILALCGLTIAGCTLAVLLAANNPGNLDAIGSAFAIGVALVAMVLLVINLGGIATLISIHDRQVDLVDEAAFLREALGRIAEAAERRNSFLGERP